MKSKGLLYPLAQQVVADLSRVHKGLFVRGPNFRVMEPTLMLTCLFLGLANLAGQHPDRLRLVISDPPNPAARANAWQGFSTAIDGETAVVGAPADEISGGGFGIVNVYDIAANSLRFVLANPEPAPGDNFGWSVAISGQRVVVGVPFAEVAHVYDFLSPVPTLPVATLRNPSPSGFAHFGWAVAIDGTRIVVGAMYDDTTEHNAGSAYVFDIASPDPSLPVAVLNNPNPTPSAFFGISVAISSTLVVVGADHAGLGTVGSAYIYDVAGVTPSVPLYVFNNPSPAWGDRFGHAVAIDGTRVVIGAEGDDKFWVDDGSVYVYDVANSATPTVPVLTLHNPNPNGADLFGCSVALSGSHLVVGAYMNNTGPTEESNFGSAYFYDLAGETPDSPAVTFKNPSPEVNDFFGWAVSASGSRVLVGAYQDDTNGTDAGNVYLFDVDGGSPATAVATLNHPVPASNDHFGHSVAIDGRHVIVGVPLDNTGAIDAGCAYVYEVAVTTPTVPQLKLINPGPGIGDNFGGAVAIDGTWLIIGVPGDNAGATDAGSAFVYCLDSLTPSLPIATLSNPSPVAGDFFGSAVAISGTHAVIGAYSVDAGGGRTPDVGAVHVYDLAGATPTTPVLTLPNPTPAPGDLFGYSLGVSGTRVIVGASRDDTGALDAGSAYVYNVVGAAPTTPVVTLSNPSPVAWDLFGASVALSETLAVVGAYAKDDGAVDAGVVYIYDLASAAPSVPVLTLNSPNSVDYGWFGRSVAVSGSLVVVGSPGDGTGAQNSGVVYLFDLSSAVPSVPVATLINPGPGATDFFGFAVAIDGSSSVVGAPRENGSSIDRGAAYVFGPAKPGALGFRSAIKTGDTQYLMSFTALAGGPLIPDDLSYLKGQSATNIVNPNWIAATNEMFIENSVGYLEIDTADGSAQRFYHIKAE